VVVESLEDESPEAVIVMGVGQTNAVARFGFWRGYGCP
jgi:hypothetical protein